MANMKYKLRMEVVVEIPARSSGVRVYSLQISYRELEGPTNALREPRCKLLGPALQGYPVGGVNPSSIRWAHLLKLVA